MSTGEVFSTCELGLQAHTVNHKTTQALTKGLERERRGPVAKEAGTSFVRGRREQDKEANVLIESQTANFLPHRVPTEKKIEKEKIEGAEHLRASLQKRGPTGGENEAVLQ